MVQFAGSGVGVDLEFNVRVFSRLVSGMQISLWLRNALKKAIENRQHGR